MESLVKYKRWYQSDSSDIIGHIISMILKIYHMDYDMTHDIIVKIIAMIS